jgi:cytochrome c biogenesis protein CcmG/thiol:disulfide interchange protein DsbE
MSNRPNRARTYGHPHPDVAASRRRLLLVLGIGVALAVAIGVAVALGGGDDTANVDDDRPSTGRVVVDGDPLPSLTSTDADPAIGATPPTLEGTDPDGAPVTVAPTGEPTVVAFLAHWCEHCQAEVPVLVDLAEEGAFDGVRLVGVLTGTDQDRPNFPPAAWLDREGWTGDVLLDDELSTAAQAYGLTGYPFVAYLDADGQVVARTSGEVGEDGIRALIDQVR